MLYLGGGKYLDHKYQFIADVSALCLAWTMAPAEGRNVRNKLFSIILAVVFMIKIMLVN